MTNEFQTPTEGLLVKCSYNPHTKTGHFRIYDIHNKTVFYKKVFKNVTTSANVMAFLGITKAIQLTNRLPTRIEVFCANDVAVIWVQKKVCNSKTQDQKLSGLIIQANEYLRCNDCGDRIQLGVPKRLVSIGEHSENEKDI